MTSDLCQAVRPALLERPPGHADAGQCQTRGGHPADRAARVLQRLHVRLRHRAAAAEEAVAGVAAAAGAARLSASVLPHRHRQPPLLGHRLGLPLRGG